MEPRQLSQNSDRGKLQPEIVSGAPYYGTDREFTSYVDTSLKALYSETSALRYHGWQHIEELLCRAATLLPRLQSEGVPVNKNVLEHAILFHDVLIQLDHQVLGFASKEALSAHYARNTLVKFGASEEHAKAVETVILATHPSVTPKTTEEMVMRAIDVQGLMAPYEQFRADTEKLRQESEALSGEPLGVSEHILGCLNYLAHFVCPVFELTPAARTQRGVSIWHERVAANVLRVFQEAVQGKGKVMMTLLHPGDSLPPSIAEEDGLVFDLAETEELRRARLSEFATWTPGGTRALLPLPLDHGLIPLPDNSIDEIYADASQLVTLYEALRVLKQGGTITFDKTERISGNLAEILSSLLSSDEYVVKADASRLSIQRIH